MNVIGHDNVTIENDARESIRQGVPFFDNHLPGLIQSHFAVHDFT